jgi:hypothetical protein
VPSFATARENENELTSVSTALPTRRSVRSVERFSRLPVWPVWGGVLVWLVGKVLGYEVADKLEDTVTG